MASPTANSVRKIAPAVWVAGAIVVIVLIAGIIFLNRPAPPAHDQGPSPEAKAYLDKLALSDVDMKATENFMKQQVVEIDGKITNNGTRQIQRIDVFCIFRGVNGQEIYRERVPVVAGLQPNQTKSFRLPFDTLPETWNQAMPNLVIAQIVFAK